MNAAVATIFAVSRNRAVWKCHDTLEQAQTQLESLAPSVQLSQLLDGFDGAGRTAVVPSPVMWRVEEIERGTNLFLRDLLVVCGHCRSVSEAGQSCGCADNGGQ